MKRRDFLRASMGGALGAGVALPGIGDPALGTDPARLPAAGVPGRPRRGAARPNLVFVFADQLGTPYCSFGGDPFMQMPHVDRLAAQGSMFGQAVASTPVCAAYRATLMTGKYATSTGMVINELRLHPGQPTLGESLARGGYRTGYLGKWHVYANEAGHHAEPRNSFIPPGPHRLGFEEFKGFNFHHAYTGPGSYYHLDSPEKVPYEAYEPTAQTDQAIDFIDRHAGGEEPFALFLSWGPPHDPWTRENVPNEDLKPYLDMPIGLPPNWSDTADPYMDRFQGYWDDPEALKERIVEWKRIYYGMTTNLDRNLGRLLRALERHGIDEDTVVVFTSDHGEQFGSHGRIQKMTFYEEAARVPFVVRWPGAIAAGGRSDVNFSSVDIMPTLLGLAGLPVPESVEGTDLSGHLTGGAAPEPEDVLLQGTGHTYLWQDGFEWRALRDGRYTYARYLVPRPEAPAELLFDHVNDPRQQRNLVGERLHREALERCRERLRTRMEELQDRFLPCTAYQGWTDGNRNIVRSATADFGPMPHPE